MGDKDIHIKIQGGKGEGISQAIKRVLEEKYDKLDIWSQAEKKLNDKQEVKETWKEIQGFFVKEADGEKSTLTNHKTDEEQNIGDLWHTFSQWRIRTDENDVITIAETTWNKILEFLGLKSDDTDDEDEDENKNNTAAISSQTVITEGEETIVPTQTRVVMGTEPIVDEVSTNIPETDENPPVDITPPKVDKIKQDKKPPEAIPIEPMVLPKELSAEELQSLKTPDESKAGQVCANEDGTNSEYDAQGNIVKVLDEKGDTVRSISKDATGNLQITDFEHGKLGKKGSTLREVTRDANGAVLLSTYSEYDKKGNMTKIVRYNSQHEMILARDYEYDRKGRKTKEVCRDAQGNVIQYTTYKYDRHGNLLQETEYNSEGKITYRETHKYNKNGFRSSTIKTDEEGKYYGGEDFEYYQNGFKKREITRDAEGKVLLYADYEYDSNGDKTKTICRMPDGKVKYYFEYKTDASGQRIYIKRDPQGKEIERCKATD